MPKPNTSYQEGEKYITEDVTSYDVAWIKKKKKVMCYVWEEVGL